MIVVNRKSAEIYFQVMQYKDCAFRRIRYDGSILESDWHDDKDFAVFF